MKISAEFKNGLVGTSLPSVPYDLSAREYDAQLLAMTASLAAASAMMIADDDEEVSMTALDAIYDFAKVLIRKGEIDEGDFQ